MNVKKIIQTSKELYPSETADFLISCDSEQIFWDEVNKIEHNSKHKEQNIQHQIDVFRQKKRKQ